MPISPRNRRQLPYPPLSEATYRDFLQETKVIDRSPFELEEHDDGSNVWPILPAHAFRSNILPQQLHEGLSISGWSDEFEHFTIFAGHADYDYLLRAETAHPTGPFTDSRGNARTAETPHYHEIDYAKVNRGKWGTIRVVPDHLVPGIEAHELLARFSADYQFVPEDLQPIGRVRIDRRPAMRTLNEFLPTPPNVQSPGPTDPPAPREGG